MSVFQRVWCLLWLVMAGAGPLPLWLHHATCHHTACRDTACQDACQNSARQPIASSRLPAEVHRDSNQRALFACGHSQCHQRPTTGSKLSSNLSGELAHPAFVGLGWPDECASCYLLSQAPQPVELAVAQPLVDLVDQAVVQVWSKPAKSLLFAYASRGPPVC